MFAAIPVQASWTNQSQCVDECYTTTLDDSLINEDVCWDSCGITPADYVEDDDSVDCDLAVNDKNPACYCETDDESLPPGQAC
jgi:hypothetical protein